MVGSGGVAAVKPRWVRGVGLFLMLACSVLAGAHAAEPARRPAPAWVIDAGRGSPDDAALAQVVDGRYYLLTDTQVRTTAAERVTFRRIATRALNATGVEGVANIEIEFDPSYETLELHTIALVRDGREIDKLAGATVRVLQREAELERRIYDGRKTASVFLDDVRVGDTVDYSFSLRGRNPVFNGQDFGTFGLRFGVPVARIHARLLSQDMSALRIEARHTALEPAVTRRDGFDVRQWTIDAVPALVVESGVPRWHDPFPAVQWTAFADWSAVVRWALPLYARPVVADAALEAEVARIAAAQPTPAGRLLETLRFVQGEVRYLGVAIGANSHAPNPPSLVLERRFGDCKDKVRLMLAMLDRLGVDAHPALVATDLRRGVRGRQPSPGQFDHVVLRAQLEGRTYWLDPTLPRQGANLDALVQADYDVALVIDEDSRSLVPMSATERAAPLRAFHATFDARKGFDEPVGYTVVTRLGGERAENQRQSYASSSAEALQNDFLNYYAGYFPGISLTAPFKVEDDVTGNRLTTIERYSIAQFSRPDDDEGRRQATIETPEMDDVLRSPKSTARSSPLAINHPVDVTLTTEVLLPGEWSIEADSIAVDDPAFSFERTIKPQRDRVVITDRYRSRVDEIAAADTPRYAANLARAREATGYGLTWPINDADATPTSPGPNWLLVVVGAMALLLWLLAALAVHRYDPPARPAAADAPQGMGGWLVLPGLGACLMPFALAILYWTERETFSLSTWTAVTTPGNASYHALYAPVLLCTLIAWIGILVFSVLLLVVYLQRRTSTPAVYTGFLLGTLAWQIVDMVFVAALPQVAVERKDVAELVRAAFGAVVWSIYFHRSRRVAATFVVRRAPAAVVPVPRHLPLPLPE
jgi:transglutaminase-like putative cysteine protease